MMMKQGTVKQGRVIMGSIASHIVRTHASNGKVHLPNTKMGKAFARALREKGIKI